MPPTGWALRTVMVAGPLLFVLEPPLVPTTMPATTRTSTARPSRVKRWLRDTGLLRMGLHERVGTRPCADAGSDQAVECCAARGGGRLASELATSRPPRCIVRSAPRGSCRHRAGRG